MINFVEKRMWFYLFSIALIIPGLISLILPNGLRRGIEFSSGTTFTVSFANPPTEPDLRAGLAEFGHPDARLLDLYAKAVQQR